MKRVIFAILVIAAFSTSAFAKYSGGSGEPNNPYQIADVNDLMTLANDANDYNKCFIMTADIDLDPCLPGNRDFTAISSTSFSGVFDGAGHQIINLTINGSGFFARITGIVKNLKLVNVSITGGNDSWNLGSLAGQNIGTIDNCSSTGSVVSGNSSLEIGGLVGSNGYNGGYIINSFSTCSVSVGGNSYYVGGFAGGSSGIIINCFSTGNVSVVDYSQEVGGFIGEVGYGSVSKCFSTGSVTGGNWTCHIGGFAGALGEMSTPDINNCYSTGDVNFGDSAGSVGGFIGTCLGHIFHCYSTGNIKLVIDPPDDIGGFAGYVDFDGSITGCFFLNTAGPDNGFGYPISDFSLKHEHLWYAYWDDVNFVIVYWDYVNEQTDGLMDIWYHPSDSYPKLFWQAAAGDGDYNGTINMYDLDLLCSWWLIQQSDIPSNQRLLCDFNFDAIVNFDDFSAFAENWLIGL